MYYLVFDLNDVFFCTRMLFRDTSVGNELGTLFVLALRSFSTSYIAILMYVYGPPGLSNKVLNSFKHVVFKTSWHWILFCLGFSPNESTISNELTLGSSKSYPHAYQLTYLTCIVGCEKRVRLHSTPHNSVLIGETPHKKILNNSFNVVHPKPSMRVKRCMRNRRNLGTISSTFNPICSDFESLLLVPQFIS